MSVSDQPGIDRACRSTLDRVTALVRLSDAGGHVVFVNKAWCETTGTTLDANLGEGWLGAVHEADRARVVLALATRPLDQPLAYQLRTRDGGTVLVSESCTPVDNGQTCAADVVHTALTRQTEQPGEQTMSKWAHELRGPLNAILGWSDLLGSSDNDPDVVQRGLKAIASNARQQALIIKRMAD